MLSKQALQELKDIWKSETGEEISDDFALEKALKVLAGIGAIYKPIKKEWNDEYDTKLQRNKNQS